MNNLLKNKKVLIGIGVVVIMILLTIPGTLGRSGAARDVQRKQDLGAIQTALNTYYRDHQSYPNTDWQTSLTTGVTPYITKIPTDPSSGNSYTYTPSPNGCSTVCTSYTLSAKLENKRDKQAPGGIYTLSSTSTRN